MLKNDPIFVTGIPRSGSSMVAGILQICDVFAGETINDRKPYTASLFENQCISGMLTKEFKENLCDPSGLFPLPAKSFFINKSFSGKCKKTLMMQGCQDEQPYFIKDDRLALVWKDIQDQFHESKWIVVCREDSEVLNAVQKTGYMRAFEKSYILEQLGKDNAVQAWEWWLQHYKDRIMELQYSVSNKTIYPIKMMYGDFKEMREIVEWVGGTWKDKEVKEFILPKLREVLWQ